MRIVVVEDEEIITRRLGRLIRKVLGDRITALDSASTLSGAVDLLDGARIDVVFLDLNLHGQDGFDLLEGAASRSFQTIVVSAKQDQALRAFEFGVTDFIPKPFDEARVRQALDRVTQREPLLRRRLKYLAVRKAGQVVPISLEEVLYIQGADDYSEIHCHDGSQHLHDKRLRDLEQLLPEPFERVHRSYIVNLTRVRAYLSKPGSRYFLELMNGKELPVSRSRYRELKSRMG